MMTFVKLSLQKHRNPCNDTLALLVSGNLLAGVLDLKEKLHSLDQATAVIEMAAEIPPTMQTLVNEITCSVKIINPMHS